MCINCFRQHTIIKVISSIEKCAEKPMKQAQEEDYCGFECAKEESMIAHMSVEDVETLICYLCGIFV